MNTKNAKKNNKAQEKEREYIAVETVEVKNVRVVNGENGDIVYFTLVLNGVTIYSCRVATGKNGDFVSFPQYKGGNGKYYYYAYAALDDDTTNNIMEMIQAEIDKQ